MLAVIAAIAFGTSLVDDVDLLPAVEVSVSFLAQKGDLPKDMQEKLIKSSAGAWANLGAVEPTKVADRLAGLNLTDDVAFPKVVVGLDGKTARLLSYLDDGEEKRGYGCEVKATPGRDSFSLDFRLGDPGENSLVNESQFRLSGGDTFLLCPKNPICGMKMVVLVRGVRTF